MPYNVTQPENEQEAFDKFLALRDSGLCNMCDAQTACGLIDLDPAEYRYILHNFTELEKKYGNDEPDFPIALICTHHGAGAMPIVQK